MKYLKKFNEDIEEKSTEDLLEEFDIHKYDINEDGTVDIRGNVDISHSKLPNIPLRFGIVKGDFSCSGNQIKTLEGSPIKVGGDFYCSINQLITLEDAPIEVNGDFWCYSNKLTSLKGSPKEVNGFNCEFNELVTLEGGPIKVIRTFYCGYNQLTSLEGAPEKVGGYFYCDRNPIYEVYKLFGTLERYKASMDYKYLRGTNIIQRRFERACIDADIKMPDSIPGYEYIDL
jgi:hypothetical protein